jgi:triphosphoribosyl-dephospho-CoA synthase
VIDYRGPLRVDDVESVLPQRLRAHLDELRERFRQVSIRPDLRVYGSMAFQAMSPGDTYLSEASDLDLLLLPQANRRKLLEELGHFVGAQGRGDLDGELRIQGQGDVAWRECHAAWVEGQERRLLIKSLDDVAMRALKFEDCDTGDEIARIAALADEALAVEARSYPKPGLVSPRDSGSHHDMDYALLTRARCAIGPGFYELARVGRAGGSFQDLVKVGRAMEHDMMIATGGVNVYRGAIFNLGLLVAATAFAPDDDPMKTVKTRYGADLLQHRPPSEQHGTQLRQSMGVGGAVLEAALGFPMLATRVLPAWKRARAEGHAEEGALIQALLASMAHLEDTNLLWRGGFPALQDVQAIARQFNLRGGVMAADWQDSLEGFHHLMKSRHLSPGGSADLAACAHFVGAWQERYAS